MADAEPEGEDESEAPQRAELRYWRERKAAAARAGPFAVADMELCDKEIQRLTTAAKAARPWATRVQGASQALEKARAHRERVGEDLAAARAAVAALEKGHMEAQKLARR